MEKENFFLYLIKSTSEAYNQTMHNIAGLYLEFSETYTGYMEYLYDDDTIDFSNILNIAKGKGIANILLDTNIDKKCLFNILTQSKKLGFCVEDIAIGIDALYNKMLTAIHCFTETRKAILIDLGKVKSPCSEIDGYVKDKNYEINLGCGSIGDLSPRVLFDIIPQIAMKEDISVVLIVDKSQFPFDENEWNDIVESLEKSNITIDSIKDGILIQEDMHQSQMMH